MSGCLSDGQYGFKPYRKKKLIVIIYFSQAVFNFFFTVVKFSFREIKEFFKNKLKIIKITRI